MNELATVRDLLRQSPFQEKVFRLLLRAQEKENHLPAKSEEESKTSQHVIEYLTNRINEVGGAEFAEADATIMMNQCYEKIESVKLTRPRGKLAYDTADELMRLGDIHLLVMTFNRKSLSQTDGLTERLVICSRACYEVSLELYKIVDLPGWDAYRKDKIAIIEQILTNYVGIYTLLLRFSDYIAPISLPDEYRSLSYANQPSFWEIIFESVPIIEEKESTT